MTTRLVMTGFPYLFEEKKGSGSGEEYVAARKYSTSTPVSTSSSLRSHVRAARNSAHSCVSSIADRNGRRFSGFDARNARDWNTSVAGPSASVGDSTTHPGVTGGTLPNSSQLLSSTTHTLDPSDPEQLLSESVKNPSSFVGAAGSSSPRSTTGSSVRPHMGDGLYAVPVLLLQNSKTRQSSP